jgi:hypothetical protein
LVTNKTKNEWIMHTLSQDKSQYQLSLQAMKTLIESCTTGAWAQAPAQSLTIAPEEGIALHPHRKGTDSGGRHLREGLHAEGRAKLK